MSDSAAREQTPVTVKQHTRKPVAGKLLLPVLFFMCCSIAKAQSFSAAIDRDKILIGEQVTLQLSIDSINPATTYIENWPALSDTFNHIEVISRSAVDSIAVGGFTTYNQNIVITSFDSGNWQLPKLQVLLRSRKDGAQSSLTAGQPTLQVLTVDVSALSEYHPIKDVIDVDVPFDWKRPLVFFIFFIIALFVAVYFIKRRSKPVVKPAPVTGSRYTLETAIEQLQQLSISDASGSEERKQFHVQMDAVIRSYLEEVMHVNATKATESELQQRLAVYVQDKDRAQLLQDVLDANKAVKFAKFVPSTYTSEAVRKDAVLLLQELDVLIQQTRRYAGTMVSKY